MKKRRRASDRVARWIALVLGLCLLLWNANTTGLYLIGDVTDAYNIKQRRLGSSESTDPNQQYRFSLSYSYRVDDEEYHAVIHELRGPWLGIEHDKIVHYYPFAPNIHSLFAEKAASAGMIISSGLGLAMILFVVVPKKGQYRNDIKEDLPKQPDRMKRMMENKIGYNDEVEEYYYRDCNIEDPSWQCECGKWNTKNFCGNCGRVEYGK